MAKHPWDEVIPAVDIESFQAGYADMEQPLKAGKKPALVIVDMTWAFVDSRYPLGWSETGYPAVAANKRLLEAARQAGIPIFFTRAYPTADYKPTPAQRGLWKTLDNPSPPDPALPPGDVIVDDLAPLPGEVVIDKQSKPRAFFGTPLASLLIYEGVDTVIVTGMTTSGCVRASVIDAFQYNFHVMVPYECVADRSQISHKVSLFDMHMKNSDVVSLAQVLEYLTQLPGKTKIAAHA
jgi:nicotinamidase-related amidase